MSRSRSRSLVHKHGASIVRAGSNTRPGLYKNSYAQWWLLYCESAELRESPRCFAFNLGPKGVHLGRSLSRCLSPRQLPAKHSRRGAEHKGQLSKPERSKPYRHPAKRASCQMGCWRESHARGCCLDFLPDFPDGWTRSSPPPNPEVQSPRTSGAGGGEGLCWRLWCLQKTGIHCGLHSDIGSRLFCRMHAKRTAQDMRQNWERIAERVHQQSDSRSFVVCDH